MLRNAAAIAALLACVPLAAAAQTAPLTAALSDRCARAGAVAVRRASRFIRTISVFDAGAGVIDVRLESRAPDGGIAVRTLRLRPRR
jgi:hypothetical protein